MITVVIVISVKKKLILFARQNFHNIENSATSQFIISAVTK